MADQQSGNSKPVDPAEPWRGVRDAYLDAWAKTMVDTVNNESYAQATGAMLETYLTVSAPFREAVERAMLKSLEQLAMPSRSDIVSLAERLTNIELRLDDLDAKIDKLLDSLVKPNPVARATPNVAAVKKVARKSRRAKKGKS
ncbi:MAG TPA: hypothetical protein VF753_17510 [Terriglobales bacterium]